MSKIGVKSRENKNGDSNNGRSVYRGINAITSVFMIRSKSLGVLMLDVNSTDMVFKWYLTLQWLLGCFCASHSFLSMNYFYNYVWIYNEYIYYRKIPLKTRVHCSTDGTSMKQGRFFSWKMQWIHSTLKWLLGYLLWGISFVERPYILQEFQHL